MPKACALPLKQKDLLKLSTTTLLTLALVSLTAACTFDSSSSATDDGFASSDGGLEQDASAAALTILLSSPLDGATDVLLNSGAVVTFSEPMDAATLNTLTFTLDRGNPRIPVTGTVRYNDSVALFQPSELFAVDTVYTATITREATSATGLQFAQNYSWTFTSGDATNVTLPIDLASAGDFAILAKTAITNVPTSAIVGDLGISPAKAAGITGFTLTADASNEFSTSPEITGKVYASDFAVPTPTKMTTAILDMESAYTSAANRTPDITASGGVDIGGTTFTRGVYQWDGAVAVSSDVTLTGTATDVWIFQIAGALTIKDSAKILLAGDARAKNIFWQTSGAVLIEPDSHCEGAILTATAITLITGASVNGRLLAQTAVTLGANSVVVPSP